MGRIDNDSWLEYAASGVIDTSLSHQIRIDLDMP
jgi:hypothetical protein